MYAFGLFYPLPRCIISGFLLGGGGVGEILKGPCSVEVGGLQGLDFSRVLSREGGKEGPL